MPNVDVYKMDGTKTGEQITLSDELFGAEINRAAMHQVVVAHLNACRQGTQSTKTRAEVSGGGIKPYRQKGTGRARQGSTRSPQWVKGGVVFAPKPRCYRQDVNKKVRRLALKSALSSKVLENELMVLESLELQAAKTKEMVSVLKALGTPKKTMIVLANAEDKTIRAARNIPGVCTIQADSLNVYDILNCDVMLATKDAVKKIEEVYA